MIAEINRELEISLGKKTFWPKIKLAKDVHSTVNYAKPQAKREEVKPLMKVPAPKPAMEAPIPRPVNVQSVKPVVSPVAESPKQKAPMMVDALKPQLKAPIPPLQLTKPEQRSEQTTAPTATPKPVEVVKPTPPAPVTVPVIAVPASKQQLPSKQQPRHQNAEPSKVEPLITESSKVEQEILASLPKMKHADIDLEDHREHRLPDSKSQTPEKSGVTISKHHRMPPNEIPVAAPVKAAYADIALPRKPELTLKPATSPAAPAAPKPTPGAIVMPVREAKSERPQAAPSRPQVPKSELSQTPQPKVDNLSKSTLLSKPEPVPKLAPAPKLAPPIEKKTVHEEPSRPVAKTPEPVQAPKAPTILAPAPKPLIKPAESVAPKTIPEPRPAPIMKLDRQPAAVGAPKAPVIPPLKPGEIFVDATGAVHAG